MRWPWSRKEQVIEYQPEEYASPEDAWAYIEQKGREAEAWRHARGSSLKQEPSERVSLGDIGIGYAFEEYRGAYKDFLDDFSNAVTDEDRMKVFHRYVRSMMARRWTRKGAVKRLIQVLIEHGLIEPGDVGLEE